MQFINEKINKINTEMKTGGKLNKLKIIPGIDVVFRFEAKPVGQIGNKVLDKYFVQYTLNVSSIFGLGSWIDERTGNMDVSKIISNFKAEKL